MARKFLVFVYGTLKQGEPNHHFITNSSNGSQTFIGAALSVNTFPLVVASRYNIPFLLDKPGVGRRIHGEVYSVDDRLFQCLDALEDYPNFYGRREQEVELKESGETIKAWIYSLPMFKPELLDFPQLDNYTHSAKDPSKPNGGAYVKKADRTQGRSFYDEVK